MIELPSSYIISSRLSALDSKDVLRIVHFAQEKWKEQEIKKRMKKKGLPILGIGISNPEELSILVANNIPVIHIQRECKSLQALQKRHFKEKKIKNRIYLWLTSSLWGMLCKFILRHKHRLKKGQDTFHFSVMNQSNVPIPHYMIGGITFSLTIGLCWITKRLLFQHIRTSEYYVHEKEGDFLLIRNDALYSKSQFIIQTIIPSFLIGFSVYYLK